MKVTAVNVGCGSNVCELPGWESIDNSPGFWLSKHSLIRHVSGWAGLVPEGAASVTWPRCVRMHNAARGLPYADSSLLYVYASHFLEHLPQDTARHFLRECFRVLTASGILRVVAPDLGLLCQQYMKSALESPSDDEFNADRFLRDTCLVADDAAERTWVRALRRLLGRDRHYWMYDEGSLLARFREAGFTSVVRRSFRESLIPDINLLDIPARASESLYVEGQKLLGR